MGRLVMHSRVLLSCWTLLESGQSVAAVKFCTHLQLVLAPYSFVFRVPSIGSPELIMNI